MTLKSSFYNLFIDCEDSDDTIIFNSLYGSMAVFELEELAVVQQILKFPNTNDYKRLRKNLKDLKFIIPDAIDEFSIIENRKQCGVEDKNRLDLTIMPTLNCNFACSYCYEKHIVSSMDKPTTDALLKWLSKEIPKYKYVIVHWFGGEPLMEIESVIHISKTLQAIAASHQVELSIQMTTNGYLLTKAAIEKLVGCGIIEYQITLDGAKEYHNTLRTLKNGKPTFDIIFQNISNLASYNKTVIISLRINFNHTNFESIPELLHQFPENIRKQLRVTLEPIFGNCSINAVDNIDNAKISVHLSNYYAMAKDLGYDVVHALQLMDTGRLVYCYAERVHQYIVNYNGDIFKCSVGNFTREERIGFLNAEGEFLKEEVHYSKWFKRNNFEDKCYPCQYLPVCMGGCIKARIENNGNTGSVCKLVPSNTSSFVKQIVLKGLRN